MEENTKNEKGETYSYKGWLNSDNFIKRMFGIYFYGILAGFIVAFVLVLVAVIFFLTFGLTGLLLFAT